MRKIARKHLRRIRVPDPKPERRYVWHGCRVWLDTGMRDALGRVCLSSLSKDGEGITVPLSKIEPVTEGCLAACERIYGKL